MSTNTAVEADVLTDRPKRVLMAAGASWEDARHTGLGGPLAGGAIGKVAFYRCIGSNLGVAEGELLLLAEPTPALEQGSAMASPARTSERPAFALLERCHPPSLNGFAALATAKSAGAPVTGMVAVCTVF